MSQSTLFDTELIEYAGDRDDLDRYYTPPELLGPLLDRWHPLTRRRQRILEPCAGRALSIARVLQAEGHEVITADLDPRAPVDFNADLLEHDWSQHDVRLVVTNPPYNTPRLHAADAIRTLLPHVRWGCFLLRLSFLEPCENRRDLVCGEGAPVRVLVNPRVSFRGSGATDSVTTAWVIWRGGQHPGRRWPRVGYHTETVHPRELERWRIRLAERGSP